MTKAEVKRHSIECGIRCGGVGGDALHIARASSLNLEAATEIAAVVTAEDCDQCLVGAKLRADAR